MCNHRQETKYLKEKVTLNLQRDTVQREPVPVNDRYGLELFARLIIEIFYSTGIRLSELINIKLKDVDTIKSQVKVLGKRNKERIIPLTKELKKSIDNYMGLRMNEKAIDRSYLLLTDSGKKLIQVWYTEK